MTTSDCRSAQTKHSNTGDARPNKLSQIAESKFFQICHNIDASILNLTYYL
jgi:hypothetical protein